MIIDNQLLNKISNQAQRNERLRMNFNLHDSLDAKTQRLFNALEVGTVLPIHRHQHSAETYILLRGHINVLFYNDRGDEIERYDLQPEEGRYGVHIPQNQWHTLEVLDSSVIFEVKDGPYMPLKSEDIRMG